MAVRGRVTQLIGKCSLAARLWAGPELVKRAYLSVPFGTWATHIVQYGPVEIAEGR